MRWRRIITGLALAAVVLCSATRLACAQTQKPPVDVLLLAGSILTDLSVDKTLARQLEAENIHFVIRRLDHPLSPEMLRQFHVVAIADWEGPKVSYFIPAIVQGHLNAVRNSQALRQYVGDGGGFLFIPAAGGNLGAECQTTFLQPYGAQVHGMQTRDDAHALVIPYPTSDDRLPDEYAWTTDITSHAVTEGVSRLFYPTTQLRWDDMYATPAMTFDPSWTVLIRGMETSCAARCIDYTQWIPQPQYRQPAISAVRAYGKGRIGAFAPSVHFSLWNPYGDPAGGSMQEMHTGKIDGIVLEKGSGKLRSDGRRYLTNLLQWLAEPARAAGMGGYTASGFAALRPPPSAQVPEWVFSWRADNGAQWFKVLIGARSAYSSGTGSIAEYAAEARKAGIGVLVFTEDFEKFDPARWEQFREDCRRASDSTLAVMPGLDIPDARGARYLLLNSPTFPPAEQLTPDGKAMEKIEYLCFTYPRGVSVIHRATTSPYCQQLLKQFQGITLYTYRKGLLEDNSFLPYQWQLFRYSNPIPLVVHEMDSPGQLAAEAVNGQQLYAAADTLTNVLWYFGEHGISHYYETPMHFQVSDGPRITALGGTPFIAAESDVPITEVLLYENYNLYRRWTPNSRSFSVDAVKLPFGRVTWLYAVVRDVKGRTAISPGMKCGHELRYTARCADRQNWFTFPNIYTGTLLEDFDLFVPTFGTLEGRGNFPEMRGPQRGDDMTSILDFAYASPAMYAQDVDLDERYFHATYKETGYDARHVQGTTRSRVYQARLRYKQFFIPDGGRQEPANVMPVLKEATISLRMPVEPSGEVFPAFTRVNFRGQQSPADMSYDYTDPKTGREMKGVLERGYLDLPKRGRIGDLIPLSDGIRVSADGLVGFALPAIRNGALPAGTTWHALFTIIDPKRGQEWRGLMGFGEPRPFSISVEQGRLDELNYVANFGASDGGICGVVTKTTSEPYLLPVKVSGINYNWEAGIWREGEQPATPVDIAPKSPVTAKPDEIHLELPAFLIKQTPVVSSAPAPLDGNPEEIGVFEGAAWARLDVSRAGRFYIGNLVLASDRDLHIGILRWTSDELMLDVNNPTDKPIRAEVWTAPAVGNCLQTRTTIELEAGSSKVIKLAKPR